MTKKKKTKRATVTVTQAKKIRELRKLARKRKPVETKEGKRVVVNPKDFRRLYGDKVMIRVLSRKPMVKFKLPGWKLETPSVKMKGGEVYYRTMYISTGSGWQTFINHVRTHYNRGVLRIIPELLKTPAELKRIAERSPESKTHIKQRKHQKAASDRIKRTKYKYPKGCDSPQDRSRYRRDQRKKRY